MNDRPVPKSAVYGASRFDDGITAYTAAALDAFERESIEALTVKPMSNAMRLKRREDIKAYIVKTLMFIGVYPRDSGFPLLVTVLEKMSDSFELDAIVRAISKESGLTSSTVERLVVGQFDLMGDPEQAQAVEYLTGAFPNTALDAIYDLALYFKKINSEDGERYE